MEEISQKSQLLPDFCEILSTKTINKGIQELESNDELRMVEMLRKPSGD